MVNTFGGVMFLPKGGTLCLGKRFPSCLNALSL
jgi:hypothetical protein